MIKLSVCIPIYNIDVSQLVQSLELEIQEQQLDAEIVLIDDASTDHAIQKQNQSFLKNHHYIQLTSNIGRSKIRNLFLDYAKGEYLLFLDCDGLIINKHFISKYFQFLTKNQDVKVIYGGRVVPQENPGSDYLLRWKFAHKRENPPIVYRKGNPYLCFQTNNFLTKKDIFEKIQFEDKLKKYGYEDVLFSFELKKAGVKIDQIDNPIFNNDVESNKAYLKHVEDSIENIAWMMKQEEYKDELKGIKLVKAYYLLQKIKLKGLYKLLMLPFKNKLKIDLEGRAISLRKLDLYKLLLLVEKA